MKSKFSLAIANLFIAPLYPSKSSFGPTFPSIVRVYKFSSNIIFSGNYIIVEISDGQNHQLAPISLVQIVNGICILS